MRTTIRWLFALVTASAVFAGSVWFSWLISEASGLSVTLTGFLFWCVPLLGATIAGGLVGALAPTAEWWSLLVGISASLVAGTVPLGVTFWVEVQDAAPLHPGFAFIIGLTFALVGLPLALAAGLLILRHRVRRRRARETPVEELETVVDAGENP